ncbi:DUF6880 family protein [Methylobacterium radiotolerans]|uniref:Uncharacterized protein n=1 Tax=Methylobacterium radiotolerans (strain ATCC 27329 / DSM 1819 / JCM 2831 / NBRC 15690 / NCIMB 10815 / 0-1) TaxID=426355 RepID=B1M252_METRJ|nr:DUF6880 family protein [Methylobacterium radiotolerans]ACB24663.1 conserved hypothetical protein [Methylobacterium radiotolerans JCM 2831]GEM97063.1 hypothetical protein MRA01_16030 [Methylobacterium radiotolerans]
MARARRVTPAEAQAGRRAPALPKGARRTTPSPETLAALGPDRLIALILGETGRNPAFKKLVSAALASLQGPEAVAAIVDRRLTALEGAQGYIDWQKRRSFAADLNTTVTVILNELRPLDPAAALDRLRRFLDGADAVLNRVDDSTGAVQAVFDRASAAFVEIAGSLPPEDAAGVAARLVEPFAADPFGPLGTVLGDMIPRLPEPALAEIDNRLAAAAAALPPGGDPRREATHHRQAARIQILRLRQTIADRRGDPDAFIALEGTMLPGRENRVAIARRLLDAGRPAEALDWIRRMQDPGLRIATRADLIAGFDLRGPERERQALEIEILDALGRGDEAQALRWGRFERELDAPMLRTFLAKLPDFEDEEALQRALDHAEAFPQPHRALAFLAGWPDLRRAAALVVARPAIWQGDQYAVLAPVAEALAQQHPRAATILYRRLLDSILETGRSAAYPHGARYLAELDALAERLAAGDVEPDPQAYRAALRQAHGRKHGFWSLVRD